MKALVWVMTRLGNTFQVELPCTRIVCPTCSGKGTHVNRAIDGNGLTAEDMQDEEFVESYMSGVYDVACEECHGDNVVAVVDEQKLTPKMLERYHRYLECESANRREEAAERAMCGGY